MVLAQQEPPESNIPSMADSPPSAPSLNGFFASQINQSSPETSDSAALSDQSSTEECSFCTEDVFEMLSNFRRRYVVYYLKQTGESVKLGPLATQIAAWENDSHCSEVTGSERKRVYTSLQQIHLSKMDDFGFVQFDKRSGVIEPTPALDHIVLDPDLSDPDQIPWHKYYSGYAAVCVAIVMSVQFGLWPLSVVPTSAWLTAIAITLVLSASVQTYLSVYRTDESPSLQI